MQVTVPTDDQGTTGTFEISVKNVERQVLPDVDEDFIKIADPEASNMADYRKRIQDRLDKTYAKRADEAFDQKLSDAMIDKTNPEFPPSMAESYLDHMVNDVTKKNQQGRQLDKDQVKEVYKPIAERNLKWYLIRNAIIADQSFEISKDDVNAEIDRRKQEIPNQAKEVEKFFKKPSNRSRLKDDLMEKKILAYLVEFAKIKVVKVKTKDLREQSETKAE